MHSTLRAAIPLLLLVPAACSQPSATLTATDAYEIRQFVPNADLTNLTADQVRDLVSVLHDGDGLETPYLIRSILK